MRILFHLWLSPFCRKVRILLLEKDLEVELKTENLWDRRREFLQINRKSIKKHRIACL